MFRSGVWKSTDWTCMCYVYESYRELLPSCFDRCPRPSPLSLLSLFPTSLSLFSQCYFASIIYTAKQWLNWSICHRHLTAVSRNGHNSIPPNTKETCGTSTKWDINRQRGLKSTTYMNNHHVTRAISINAPCALTMKTEAL